MTESAEVVIIGGGIIGTSIAYYLTGYGLKDLVVVEKEFLDLIRDELGEGRVRVCQIGPAGENLVRYASIMNDLTHFAGRTGLGAVMGSKKLRAIAVQGRDTLLPAQPERIRELARWMAKNFRTVRGRLHDFGTAGIVQALNFAGGLPTRNFQDGCFEGAGRITGEVMSEQMLAGRETCYACPIRCKRVVAGGARYEVNPRYGGPEYETVAALGSNCGIDDLEAISKGNELCGRYGLDSISTGAAVAFAMECAERGLIPSSELPVGVDLRFGDPAAMLHLVEMIAHRDGLGDVLADGVRRAARRWGEEAGELALEVKGQEVPMHEPRLKMGLGLGYAVSPTGADHCHNLHDTMFAGTVETLKPLGILEPLPAEDLSARKVRLFTYYSNWMHFLDSAILCHFVPWSMEQVVTLVQATTGWQTSLWELVKVGERAATLARCYNWREGFRREDDRLPRRFFSAQRAGPLGDQAVSPVKLDEAIAGYYAMMGWDSEGRPRSEKLAELGIADLIGRSWY